MNIKYIEKTLVTTKEIELINITNEVKQFVVESKISNGIVFIISKHTTTAITVNEGLPDLEADIVKLLTELVPENMCYYRHARFLHSDGQLAINAHSHLRGALLGFEAFFPIINREIISHSRQTIYFVELDGPQERTYILQVLGE